MCILDILSKCRKRRFSLSPRPLTRPINTHLIPRPLQDGCTPLMYAASVGHIDILKFLMEKGVLLEEKNEDGFTALHWAAYVGKSFLQPLLILIL